MIHAHPSLTVSSGNEVPAHFYLWSLRPEVSVLLDKIAFEAPERSKELTWAPRTVHDLGYQGRRAADLRSIWDDVRHDLMDWVCEAERNSPAYDARREAYSAFCRTHSSDALISQRFADDMALTNVVGSAWGMGR